ncbi:Uncharacterised protein [Actinomyces viscosus]|uniref:Uncharacterized protein n=1 Tax=Actinomyces viscosus TaxID=1656 RepID=A0A448PN09_ACTVI|nr:Uncharacterised protein [Actinomyces viscosus]
MDATHIMTTPYPPTASSSVGTENVTDFMLAPGETSVYGQQFLVSLLAPYLKGQLMCSSSRFVYKVPNTLLGIIPVGTDENTIPINSISAVSTSSRFSVGRAFLALVFAIFGLAILSDRPLGGIFCIILAILFGVTALSSALVVTNHAGGSFGITVSMIDNSKLNAFRTELQNRVFADREAMRHGEAQDLRMQSLAMQQMQLAQMQQAQFQQAQMQQPALQQPQAQPQAQPGVQQAQIQPGQQAVTEPIQQQYPGPVPPPPGQQQ